MGLCYRHRTTRCLGWQCTALRLSTARDEDQTDVLHGNCDVDVRAGDSWRCLAKSACGCRRTSEPRDRTAVTSLGFTMDLWKVQTVCGYRRQLELCPRGRTSDFRRRPAATGLVSWSVPEFRGSQCPGRRQRRQQHPLC